MEAIEKAGIAEKTIFIYTSDQGYSLGELNLCEKHYAYEQVMRVPLIVRFPHHKNPGNPPPDMVMNMDIAPTVLDYCVHKIPKSMEGESWRSLQESKNKQGKPFREAFFFDFWHNEQEILPPMQAVRTEKFKYVRYEYQPYEELYYIGNDPVEKVNLAGDEVYQKVKQDLSERLDHWKKRTGWITRSSVHLNHVYVSPALPSNESENAAIETQVYNFRDLTGKKSVWKKMEREGEYFNLQSLIPEDESPKILYMAIPVVNHGKFDPFISLRFVLPGTKETNSLAYTAFYGGKEIYQSAGYKKMKKIKMIDPNEEALRRMFDLGYNPPLKQGKNIIMLKMFINNESSAKWDIIVVGGLCNIKWM
jgi:hypothetical protein